MMNYVSLKKDKNSESKLTFDNFHINSSRRDLLKQLFVAGTLSTTSLLNSPFSLAAEDSSITVRSLDNATSNQHRNPVAATYIFHAIRDQYSFHTISHLLLF
jgi:hypothetical protein